MYFSQLASKSLLLLGLTLGLVGCSKAPDPQDDIPLFKAFIAENIDKVSDDPYISSTVKPGDKMYEFLKYLQHGSGRNRLIKTLVDNGDPEAMLWFARLNLGNTEIRGQVLQLMRDSMLAGNPYAALELSEGSESCTYYFGQDSVGNNLAEMAGLSSPSDSDVCSKDNFTKAVKGFEKLAKEGDLRAQYFLLKQKHWDQSKETRADYIREVIRFAEAHYYQPLMDYVGTILYYSKEAQKDVSNSQEQHELAIQLLTVASNNNYIPAIDKLYFAISSKDEKNKLLNKTMLLGDVRMIRYQYYQMQDDSPEQYYYNVIIKELSGDYVFRPRESKENLEVKKQAKAFLESIHSSVYIDGFTDSSDWHSL
ncbi:sel1 repeat family protein [Vibrio owensii]|uniref:sel1 repeat family protein n=1 Tax=Vibrio owensii TaxID=696485 RepID=UPI0022DDDA0F|nr:sel1 repeat family protein [Vibrio owensii]MDA0385193.1 sel1 repeat family protein [Vibrio owensii]